MNAQAMATALCLVVFAVVSCQSSSVDQGSASTDPVSAAITAGLVDCFDPLHDSDGSGGFFAFCERADEAKAAGKLDCLRPEHKPGSDDCDGWRMTRDQVPFYYFDIDDGPPPAPVDESTPPPPARAVDEPELTIDGYPVDLVVIEWNLFGGCDIAPDGCATYRVFGDGRVEATQGQAVGVGQVDPALVTSVIEKADVDSDALLASVPTPGPCQAASDGISGSLVIPAAGVSADTCEYDLEAAVDPLIPAALTLAIAATTAVDLN